MTRVKMMWIRMIPVKMSCLGNGGLLQRSDWLKAHGLPSNIPIFILTLCLISSQAVVILICICIYCAFYLCLDHSLNFEEFSPKTMVEKKFFFAREWSFFVFLILNDFLLMLLCVLRLGCRWFLWLAHTCSHVYLTLHTLYVHYIACQSWNAFSWDVECVHDLTLWWLM